LPKPGFSRLFILSICICDNLFLNTIFRPPGIYKGDYIAELYRRYDDVENASLPPELPNWHTGDLIFYYRTF